MKLKSKKKTIPSALFRTGSIALATVIGSTIPVMAAELVGHRAIYEVSLADKPDGPGIVSATGRVVLEFDGNECQGYTTTMRFLTKYGNSQGSESTTDVQSSTWEGGAGEAFRFHVRQYLNGALQLSSQGKAANGGDEIAIDLEEPEEKNLGISGDVLFPTQHLNVIIEEAESGNRFVQRDVFDGSDTGDKVYATNAVIGKPSKGEVEGIKGGEDLNGVIFWPVSLAYFEEDNSGEQLPVYQMSFDLFRNGVSTDVVIDYGELALRAKLSEIEFFEPIPCDE